MVAKKSDTGVNAELIAKREQTIHMLNAPAYRPDAGDTLTAHLVGVRKGGINSEYGIYPVLYFQRADGFPFPKGANDEELEFIAFHGYHSIVKTRLAELKPRPDGTLMTVHYAGIVQFGSYVDGKDGPVYVELKGKNDYEKYTLLLGDGTELETIDEFDWDTDLDGGTE